MTKKIFSIAILKIGDDVFSINDFLVINQIETDDLEVNGEIIHNTVISKETRSNRFISITFEEGGTLPRPTVVYNTDLKIDEDNPRTEKQIERDSQTFILIDTNDQKIFISDFRKKNLIEGWLSAKLNKMIFIKNIIDKESFIEQTKSIDSIYLSAMPTLFSTTGILGQELVNDFHNYGVGIKHIGVSIKFNDNNLPDLLKQKILYLFGQQENQSIDKLVISGRSADDKFERIFNIDGIIDKISVDVVPEDSGLFNKEIIFTSLILKIQGI